MKKKMFDPSANKHLRLILTVIMLAAVLMAVWLFASPALEKQEVQSQQKAMIADVEKRIETAISEPTPPVTTASAPDVEYEPLPEILPEPEKEPVPIGTELGILTIEKIQMTMPVVEGVEKELLDIAVGHVPQTAAIGDIGNAVLAGHRMYDYGRFFNRLGEVEYGDIILFTSTDGVQMSFTVDEILVIEPDDQTAFEQPLDKAQITLYTCTPIREATHRLLVRASLTI